MPRIPQRPERYHGKLEPTPEDFGSIVAADEWYGWFGGVPVVPQCVTCRHYREATESCPAFPAPMSIPAYIFVNQFDHQTELWPGQVGEWLWEPEP